MHRLHPVVQAVEQGAQLEASLRIHGIEVIPLILKAGFSLQQLDVFNALHGLDQHGVAQRGFTHAGLGQIAQTLLRQQAGQEQQHKGSQRHPDQPAGDKPEDHAEQQKKWQISHCRHRGGGQHFTHRLQLADLRDKGACCARTGAVAHSQSMAKHAV